MAVAFRANALGNSGQSVTNANVPIVIPASAQGGDVAFVSITAATGTGVFNTVPAGWYVVPGTPVLSGTVDEVWSFTHTMTGTVGTTSPEAGTTVTWIFSVAQKCIANMDVFSGVDPSSTFDAVASASSTTTNTVLTTPTMTPKSANCLIYEVFSGRTAATTNASGTLSALLTSAGFVSTNFPALPNLTQQTAYRTTNQTAPASTGGDTATYVTTNTNQVTLTISVQPPRGASNVAPPNYPGFVPYRNKFRSKYKPLGNTTTSSAGAISATLTQIAATVTATGGTQVLATSNFATLAQLAATVTATGGTQTTATSNFVSLIQVAATVTTSGGTQVIATVNNVAVTQVAAVVTVAGGTQVVTAGAGSVSASVTQLAATVTATGGTQVVASVQNATLAQLAATVTASGGTQVLATSNFVAITQVAATVTTNGGVQTFATVQNSSLAQIAATVTTTGGTQVITAQIAVTLTQIAATVTVSGGTQSIATVNSAVLVQVAAVVTASGGNQFVSAHGGTVTTVAYIMLTDGTLAIVTRSKTKNYVQLQNGRSAVRVGKKLYMVV